MILRDLILQAKPSVVHVRSDDTLRDLRLLAAQALNIEASRITLHLHDDVDENVQAVFQGFVRARAKHMPISKILKKRQFWGREFEVDLNVLDPRGDTETLIEACLKAGPFERVLDLGTGSGAIGLTLAAQWPAAKVICSDVSESALAVARRNMHRFDLAGSVTLVRSDWFENLNGPFDLIVSNPPYISLDEWSELDLEVRDFDPRLALTDDGDGLLAYREIASKAKSLLTQGGQLMVEIGWQQKAQVTELFTQAGFCEIECLPDLAGRDRVIKALSA